MAQFGSVIPNAVRELTRSKEANIGLSRSLTAFLMNHSGSFSILSTRFGAGRLGMTDLWGAEFRYFFVARI
jgi:hypothetical protein